MEEFQLYPGQELMFLSYRIADVWLNWELSYMQATVVSNSSRTFRLPQGIAYSDQLRAEGLQQFVEQWLNSSSELDPLEIPLLCHSFIGCLRRTADRASVWRTGLIAKIEELGGDSRSITRMGEAVTQHLWLDFHDAHPDGLAASPLTLPGTLRSYSEPYTKSLAVAP